MPLLHVITSIEMDGKVGDTICLIHIVLPYVILNFFLSKLWLKIETPIILITLLAMASKKGNWIKKYIV